MKENYQTNKLGGKMGIILTEQKQQTSQANGLWLFTLIMYTNAEQEVTGLYPSIKLHSRGGSIPPRANKNVSEFHDHLMWARCV